MNKRILLYIVVILAMVVTIIGFYWTTPNAVPLGWSQYKVPEYPIGGSDNETTYTINPETILLSLEQGETNVFVSTPSESDAYMPPNWSPGSFAWSQEDHLKVANALHQFVWKDFLKDWHLYSATFWVSRPTNESISVDYAHFLFYQVRRDSYVVHDLTIDLLYGNVTAGENTFHDKGWGGFNLSELKIKDVNQVMVIADKNGGTSACLSVNNKCHMHISLGPSLADYKMLFLSLHRYEWNWKVYYYNEAGDVIFRMTIDPYTGVYKVLNTSP